MNFKAINHWKGLSIVYKLVADVITNHMISDDSLMNYGRTLHSKNKKEL